jgi:hypothetical protein
VKTLPQNLQFVTDADMPALLTVSPRTWDRMKQSGDCPIKTQISQWRVAYRSDHIEQWLNTKVSGDSWQPIGDAAERVVESFGADIRDHNIKMQDELNQQRKKGK